MSHIAPEQPQPGERLVRIGAAIFGIGLLGALAVVVPFFFGRANAPLPLALSLLLLPVGLGVSLLGLLRSARRARH